MSIEYSNAIMCCVGLRDISIEKLANVANVKASLVLIELQSHTNPIESTDITCSSNKFSQPMYH